MIVFFISLQQIFLMQFVEDISPWKETEQSYHQNHSKEKVDRSNSIKVKRSAPETYFQLESPRPMRKAKIRAFEPAIVMPELMRSKSTKQASFQSLPKFQNKRVLERQSDKIDLFKTNQLISIAKSYSKAEEESKSPKKSIPLECSPLYLKSKLEGLLKLHENSSFQNDSQLIRNQSELSKGKFDAIIAKQKNIIFLYTPLSSSLKKNPEQSPKKKLQNHILDKLLSDWK